MCFSIHTSWGRHRSITWENLQKIHEIMDIRCILYIQNMYMNYLILQWKSSKRYISGIKSLKFNTSVSKSSNLFTLKSMSLLIKVVGILVSRQEVRWVNSVCSVIRLYDLGFSICLSVLWISQDIPWIINTCKRIHGKLGENYVSSSIVDYPVLSMSMLL